MSDDALLNENPALYFQQKREAAVKEVPALIESGCDLIYPELHEEWSKLVTSSSRVYYGNDIKAALKIMTALNLGASIDEAKQIFDGLDLSGSGISAVTANVVRDFSKRGPEFWLAVSPGEISLEDLRTLSDIQKRNNAIERNNDIKQATNHN